MQPILISQLEVENFSLDIEITHLINLPPDPTCRDSADDFAGIREMEWRITYAIEYGEDGRVIECGELESNLKRITRTYSSEIEAKLWKLLDDAKEARTQEGDQ